MSGNSIESLSVSDAGPKTPPESISMAASFSPADQVQAFGAARSAGAESISSRETATFAGGAVDFGSHPDIYASAADRGSSAIGAGAGGETSAGGETKVGGDTKAVGDTKFGGDTEAVGDTKAGGETEAGGDTKAGEATKAVGDTKTVGDIKFGGETKAAGDTKAVEETPRLESTQSAIRGRVPELDLPTVEQIRTAPLDQLEQSLKTGRDALIDCMTINIDSIPERLGLHGGTEQSNDKFFASGGSEIVPEGATGGDRNNTFWVHAITAKSTEVNDLASDIISSCRQSSAYAAPKWITTGPNWTPGGVIVLDITDHEKDLQQYLRYQERRYEGVMQPVVEDKVQGFGQAENVTRYFLPWGTRPLDDGSYKGSINLSEINQYDPLVEDWRGMPDDPRYKIAEEARNQLLLSETLKILLKPNTAP